MNAKKAKLLRSLVGGIDKSETKYQVQKDTVRIRQVKNLLGVVEHEYRTGTIELAPGARKLYKDLKKGYLRAVKSKSAMA